MKRFFLSALAVLSLATSAHATSLRDVRLNYHEVLNGSGPVRAESLVSIIVFGDGEAVRFTCDAETPRACDTRTIRRYTAQQIDSLDRLINAARNGRIVRVASTARCIVAPAKTDHYSADNGNVLLYKGHFCTSAFENSSPSAKRLVGILQSLRGAK